MTDAMTNAVETNPPTATDREAGIKAARESFHGRTLTEAQFEEAWSIAGIMHTKIHQIGSFRDPLTDYARSYARDQRFDSLRGEEIVRDVYKGRYGETMNETRKRLDAAAENLSEEARERAFTCAMTISDLIQAPPTQPFYKAYDRAAVSLASEFKISQRAAKTLMKEVYQAKLYRDLAATGKEAERLYHKPVRDAQIAERKAEQQQSRSHVQSRS